MNFPWSSTPSSRCSYGDDVASMAWSRHTIAKTQLRQHVASMAWDARNLISTQVAPPVKVPREAVGALASLIPDYKACLSGLESRLGTGPKLRQPTGFGRGFLNAPAAPAPAPRRRSRSRSNSSSTGFRRGFLG